MDKRCRCCEYWIGVGKGEYAVCLRLSDNDAFPMFDVLVPQKEFSVETHENFSCSLFVKVEEDDGCG